MTMPSTSNSAPTTLLSESELVRSALFEEYELLEELGRGGMAVVFRAREKALDREVAIKVLPARLMIDKEFVERFEHEARTAAKLEHPNIVPIYRVGRAGQHGEVIYFVMKLLRGQSLSAVLRERGKLEASDVRRILMETASALGYAAKRNVVHRDIKPDNIMLDSEGRCVVTDFGIAKAPGGQQTAAGTSLGTPRYMSPEHAMGMPLEGRSDMYSLGIVAYECLIGKTPFEGEDPFAVLYKHINEPVPEPTLTTDDERQLYGVIARMLAKKPDDRFQTGNELVAALGGQISDPSLVASMMMSSSSLMAPTEKIPTPQPWYMPWWKKRTRNEQWVWAGGAAAAILMILFLATMRRDSGAAPSAALPNTAAAQNVASPGAAAPIASGSPATAAADSTRKADSLRIAQASKTPPKSGPSARAAEILAYNKFKSACPTRDTLATSNAIAYAVRLDSLRDRPLPAKLPFAYDVCGLTAASPFTAQFTLTKLGQHGFRQQQPHTEIETGIVQSPRQHRRSSLDMRQLSSGSYQLKVVVIDARKRPVTATREFKITDK